VLRPRTCARSDDDRTDDDNAAFIVTNKPSRPLSADEFNLALDHAGDLAQLLQEAERETRARLYRTLDLVLNLNPVGNPPTLDVRLQLCGGGGRI
jgi:hypothetical protein